MRKWTKLNNSISILLLFPIGFLNGQMIIEGLLQFGTTSNEVATDCLFTAKDELVIAAGFNETFPLPTSSLNAAGRNDAVLINYDFIHQVPNWFIHLNSPLDDKISAMEADKDGHVFIAGSYGLSLQLGTYHLSNEFNSKGLYIAKISREGSVLWAFPINGNGVQEINDLAIDGNGNVYATGHFSGGIHFGNTTLEASGNQDLFFSKFNPNGTLEWVGNAGGTGKTQARRIISLPDNSCVIAGIFDGQIRTDTDTVTANTKDRDVFLLHSDGTGQLNWLTKAGGVFDDELQDLALGPNGNLHLFGHFIGVLTLNDSLSIQSQTRNQDLFLLKYNLLGQALEAHTFGGSNVQQAADITFLKDQILLTGVYQGPWQAGNTKFQSSATFSGFILKLDPALKPKSGIDLPMQEGMLFPERLCLNNAEQVLIWTSISGTLAVNQKQFASEGGFDALLLQLQEKKLTEVQKAAVGKLIRIFPNPSNGVLSIESDYNIQKMILVNPSGKVIKMWPRFQTKITVNNVPKGVYFLKLYTRSGLRVERLDLQ